MDWIPNQPVDWMPTAIVGALMFLSKNVILNRLTKAVQHEYDIKIEAFRADLQKAEQKISANEKKIEIASSHAISGYSQRQWALYQKKLDAAEKLWGTVVKLGSIQNISLMLGYVDIQATIKNLNQQRTSKFIASMWSVFSSEIESGVMKCTDAENARIFLPADILDLFDAYVGILSYYVLILKMLHLGSENVIETKTADLVGLTKRVLPESADHIEQYKEECFFALAPVLKSKLRLKLIELIGDDAADSHATMRGVDIFRKAAQGFGVVNFGFEVPPEIQRKS